MPIKKTTTKKAIIKKVPAAKTVKGAKAVVPKVKKPKPVKKEKPAEFAVIATGGKQYKVAIGETISIEKLSDKFAHVIGDTISFDVVAYDDGTTLKLGAPYVTGMKVMGELLESAKGEKIRVQRFRSKSNWHRAYGHRQPFMKVKIMTIK
jgi:large subunit ribosomal protein L21